MDKNELHTFCKDARASGLTWNQVWVDAKKKKIITNYVTEDGLKEIYREVAGELAANGGKTEAESFDTNLKSFFKFIGKSRANIQAREKTKVATDKDITIVISDVHVPYHDMEKIMRAVDHGKAIGAKRLIIAGDYLNGTQLSTHPKLVVEDFQKEVSEGRMLLELLSADFEEIILMDDNHVHSRWLRFIAKNLPADLHFLTTHPYDYLVAGLPNVKRASKSQDFVFAEELGWLYKIGDAIFTHAEVGSSVEFKAVRGVQNYLRKWAPVFNWGDIRFVAQAHNHNLGIFHDIDSAIAFTGCMVSLEGLTYSMGARAAGGPPIHGYIVLVQRDGKTDLEETQVVRIPLV